ncbi:MAG: aminotransferase class I/II-fold pyridoxal phosphate-dependent enzyme [Ignisphaera sp.]|nr:aminotransferase class I/II-fold pyridoxal phosphate-dependent enzyme [Ignisphaera sp.]MCX8168206.1 aminotransferase class I/II-fold pyridoxal phosphate-dependent enzyme [Ignisphaera sp.]MDW8084924.1 histidinol-phosphate transaminase [Ignisphaera sp.]
MLYQLRAHGGTAPSNCIDFSTPINPLGVPEVIKQIICESIKDGVYSSYPDYSYKMLREAVAEFYDINHEFIVPLNGAAEALYLIVGVERPTAAMIFEPTFGDHRPLFHILSMNYISIQYTELFDRYTLPFNILSSLSKSIHSRCIVLFSNPNNPLGVCVPVETIEKILQMYRRCIIIVDEAFIELSNNCESTLRLTRDYENIIVLRSLTKTFSVPGLRIGFLYTSNTNLLYKIELFRQPWNLNSITNYVFSRALHEYRDDLRKFIEYSKHVIECERQFLEQSLHKLRIHFYRSSAPFILVRFHTDVKYIGQSLRRLGVWIRDASTFQSLTKYHGRISVKLRKDNERLINVLKSVLEEEYT